jgi:hypothetical protein
MLTFFMKTVSCREHLSTFSFRTEMSLRVLEEDRRAPQSLCEASLNSHVVTGFIPNVYQYSLLVLHWTWVSPVSTFSQVPKFLFLSLKSLILVILFPLFLPNRLRIYW